jgi:hypothetical protein
MNEVEVSDEGGKYRGYLFDAPGFSANEYASERTYTTHIQDEHGVVIDVIKPNEIVVFPCKGCTKNFASKQSLERHLERFPLCKEWKEGDGKLISESVTLWADKLVSSAIQGETYKACAFCKTEFSNVGNFNKHFASAVTCNRLAYAAVKKTFAEA